MPKEDLLLRLKTLVNYMNNIKKSHYFTGETAGMKKKLYMHKVIQEAYKKMKIR